MKSFLAWILLWLIVTVAGAQAGTPPWGPRAGFSLDPDQFVFGAHVQVSEPTAGLSIQPNVEMGLGNDTTTLQINGDIAYTFPELETLNWGWYAGGGVSWAYYWFDASSTGEIGLSLLGGVSKIMSNDNRLSLELRFGIDEMPDFKVTLGFWFH